MPLIAICDDCYYAHELGSTSGPLDWLRRRRTPVPANAGRAPSPVRSAEPRIGMRMLALGKVVDAPLPHTPRSSNAQQDENVDHWITVAERVVERVAPKKDPGPIVNYLVIRKEQNGEFDGVLPTALGGEENKKLRYELYTEFEKELASSRRPSKFMYNWG